MTSDHTSLDTPTVPRPIRDPEVRALRRAMLGMSHISELTNFVERLRKRRDAEYPYFDPLDGGTKASLLFLYEKPGPMTAGDHNPKGSGFISQDNE